MRRPPIAAGPSVVLAAAGCGSGRRTQVACLNGSGAYLRALRRRPAM